MIILVQKAKKRYLVLVRPSQLQWGWRARMWRHLVWHRLSFGEAR
jgi:hypothetical protein